MLGAQNMALLNSLRKAMFFFRRHFDFYPTFAQNSSFLPDRPSYFPAALQEVTLPGSGSGWRPAWVMR